MADVIPEGLPGKFVVNPPQRTAKLRGQRKGATSKNVKNRQEGVKSREKLYTPPPSPPFRREDLFQRGGGGCIF